MTVPTPAPVTLSTSDLAYIERMTWGGMIDFLPEELRPAAYALKATLPKFTN